CTVEHVHFIKYEVSNAVHRSGTLYEFDIHPVALARTAGGCSVFFAELADFFEYRFVRLEFFISNVSFVRFCNSPYFTERARGKAVHKRACGRAVARGDKRIFAPVYVEPESL